jgi:hypothetical protein
MDMSSGKTAPQVLNKNVDRGGLRKGLMLENLTVNADLPALLGHVYTDIDMLTLIPRYRMFHCKPRLLSFEGPLRA